MNIRATKRGVIIREQILIAIVEYIKVHKYPPTVRELCEITGLKSTSSIHIHLTKLLESGDIETDHGVGTPRAIRVSEKAMKRLGEINNNTLV